VLIEETAIATNSFASPWSAVDLVASIFPASAGVQSHKRTHQPLRDPAYLGDEVRLGLCPMCCSIIRPDRSPGPEKLPTKYATGFSLRKPFAEFDGSQCEFLCSIEPFCVQTWGRGRKVMHLPCKQVETGALPVGLHQPSPAIASRAKAVPRAAKAG